MKQILFNGAMVRAILEGRKTVTRRPVDWDIANGFDVDSNGSVFAYINQATGDSFKPEDICRYQPGDILYAQETWKVHDLNDGAFYMMIKYRADGSTALQVEFSPDRYKQFRKFYQKNGWQSSMFMPREAARIFLKVTGVRVERLQEITPAGVLSEGMITDYDTYCLGFRGIWDSIYAKRGYGWEQKPWVEVTEFERIEL